MEKNQQQCGDIELRDSKMKDPKALCKIMGGTWYRVVWGVTVARPTDGLKNLHYVNKHVNVYISEQV